MSDDDDDQYNEENNKKQQQVESEEEEEQETATEKRLRLAKSLISSIERQNKIEGEEINAEELDKEIISSRLKREVLEAAGKVHTQLADRISEKLDENSIQYLKGHQLPVTSVVLSEDAKYAYSASKDSSIIKWDLETGAKVYRLTKAKDSCHNHNITDLSLSSDGKFLASSGFDKTIKIWDAQSGKLLHTFNQHRDVVSGVVFRRGSHQLFSSSHDRTVKVWDIAQMTYVETLFGHQEGVTAIDSLAKERCVTVGGRDQSLRLWKIVEESQLVFNTEKGSLDTVSQVNEDYILTGNDAGTINLWNVNKRKPVSTIRNAHGESNWISSLTSYRYSDLFTSGSSDGYLNFWKIGEGFKEIHNVKKLPVKGFINSIDFSYNGQLMAMAIGQEHRLGRWFKQSDVKNSVAILPLSN